MATERCQVFEGVISADSKTFCTLLIRKMNFDLPSSTLRFSRESKRNYLTYSVMYLLSYFFMPIKAFCFPCANKEENKWISPLIISHYKQNYYDHSCDLYSAPHTRIRFRPSSLKIRRKTKCFYRHNWQKDSCSSLRISHSVEIISVRFLSESRKLR